MTKPIIGIGSDVLQRKGERDRAFAFTTYVESLRRAGAVPVVIPPQPETAEAIRHVGQGLRVAALAPDGIIEGIEEPSHPFYVGVQWHPEDMPTEKSAESLFGAFVDAARRYAETKRSASTDLSPVGAAESE